MNELKNIIEGITNLNRENDIKDDFVKSLREKIDKINKDTKERLLRELYNVMAESGDSEFLNNIMTDEEVLFFAERISEKIANSTLQDEQLSRIEKVDSDIMCNWLSQISAENISDAPERILNAFSSFIDQHMLNSQFNISAHAGAKAFKNNIYLFKTIFCITLKCLKDSDAVTMNKNLYQHLIFEYLALPEIDNDSMIHTIIILSFLWILVKNTLKLNANITVSLRKNNEGPYGQQLAGVLNHIFAEVSKMNSMELKPYLKIIENFDKLYDFLGSLEIINQSEGEGFKKKVIETLIELCEEDDAIRKNNSVIMIDFHILLSNYVSDKYSHLIERLSKEDKNWFIKTVFGNLKDDERSDAVLEETVRFLLEDGIKDKWNRDIEKELMNLLKKKMELEDELKKLFEESDYYISSLLEEIVSNRREKLELVYIPFGKIFLHYVTEYVQGKEEHEEKVQFIMSKISRILKRNDIDTLFQNLLNFIKSNLMNIQMEKLENLISSNKRQFKKRLTQNHLKNVGREIISNNFEINSTRIFLTLIKFSPKFKDTISLGENIKKYKRGKQEDEEILEILNEIERFLKAAKE